MKAKRSLGQNFLKSRSVVVDVVTAGEVSSNDVVLEIGPGKGFLTQELLKIAKKVVAIEKDDNLYQLMNDRFAKDIERGKLELINGDVLKENFNFLGNYKLIANIPYNITGEIFKKFLSGSFQPKLMALLIQHEVAERIVVEDGKESLLSISVGVYGKAEYIKKVLAESFSPAPKVDSAILLVKDISKEFFKGIDEKKFFDFVRVGFSQKRKMLRNILKPVLGENLNTVFEKSDLDKNLRAEKLKTGDWKKLFITSNL